LIQSVPLALLSKSVPLRHWPLSLNTSPSSALGPRDMGNGSHGPAFLQRIAPHLVRPAVRDVDRVGPMAARSRCRFCSRRRELPDGTSCGPCLPPRVVAGAGWLSLSLTRRQFVNPAFPFVSPAFSLPGL